MDTLNITKENFDKEVLESNEPVLLDFWADWCGPCRMVSPIIDEIAKEVKGQAKVGKINIDEETELAKEYKVMSIPTLILFKNGLLVTQVVGARPLPELEAMIQKVV